MKEHSQTVMRWIVVGGCALLFTAGAAYYFRHRSPAPDVTFITLKGEALTTRALKGRVVYVNFWATSCPTCIKEMPDLIKMYNRYHDRGFELLAVAMQYDPPNYVLNYTEKSKLPFKVVLDAQGKIAQAFGGVMVTPTAFLIDKQGGVFSRFLGEPDFKALYSVIENELAR